MTFVGIVAWKYSFY